MRLKPRTASGSLTLLVVAVVILLLVLLVGGCADADDEQAVPVGALADYVDLDPEKASKTWGLPADFLSVGRLEQLVERLPGNRSRIRAHGRVTLAGGVASERAGSVRWDLLEAVPARDTILVGLHRVEQRDVADMLLLVPTLPFSMLGLEGDERPYGLIDAVDLARPLQPGEARLWDDNLRRMGIPEGRAGLRSRLEKYVTGDVLVAGSRVGEVFDHVQHTQRFSEEPDPALVLTFVVPLAPDTPGEILAVLGNTAPLMGLTVETGTHRGVTYARGVLDQQILDFQFIRPAWAVVADKLVMSSYEPRLLQVLDTLKAPDAHPSLAGDACVRQTVAQASEGVRRLLMADLRTLCRAPEGSKESGRPCGWHWDGRNRWVLENFDLRALAMAHREKLVAEYQAEHSRRPEGEAFTDLERRVEAFVDAEAARYPEHVEVYRKRLAALERLQFLAVTYAASDGGWTADLDLHLAD